MHLSLRPLRLAALLALLGAPAAAQEAATACFDVAAEPGRGLAAAVHPTALRERYAAAIVARDWETAIRGYVATIDSTLRASVAESSRPSAAYTPVAESYRRALAPLADAATDAVRAPRRDWARLLRDAEINQARPVPDEGRALIMQRSTGEAITIPLDAIRPEERDALCWSAWGLYRLLGTVNFETVPAAFARVEATAGRWTRYQDGGPLQLPHELLLNRLARPLVGGIGAGRYDPPRITLTAVHPFAGVELRRTGNAWANDQGAAVHLAGFTVWLGDWKTNVGASWIAAASGDGTVGQGALLRFGDLVNIGFIDRRVAGGPLQRSAIFQLDALKLIASDARAKQALAALGISGEIFETTRKDREP